MLTFLANTALLSLREPRRGLRLILDNVQGAQAALLLFGLAVVVSCLAIAFVWIVSGPPDFGPLPDGVPAPSLNVMIIASVVSAVMEFAVLTGAIFGIGKLFGGKGKFLEIAVAVSWLSMLSSPLAPFLQIRPNPEAPLFGVKVWQLGMMFFVFWLLICFIAEAHRFKSAWRVGGFFLGFAVFLALISTILTPGAA